MLEAINVRFFALSDEEPIEIEHREFVEFYAVKPEARIDIEYHSVFANGVRQLCITINEEINDA